MFIMRLLLLLTVLSGLSLAKKNQSDNDSISDKDIYPEAVRTESIQNPNQLNNPDSYEESQLMKVVTREVLKVRQALRKRRACGNSARDSTPQRSFGVPRSTAAFENNGNSAKKGVDGSGRFGGCSGAVGGFEGKGINVGGGKIGNDGVRGSGVFSGTPGGSVSKGNGGRGSRKSSSDGKGINVGSGKVPNSEASRSEVISGNPGGSGDKGNGGRGGSGNRKVSNGRTGGSGRSGASRRKGNVTRNRGRTTSKVPVSCRSCTGILIESESNENSGENIRALSKNISSAPGSLRGNGERASVAGIGGKDGAVGSGVFSYGSGGRGSDGGVGNRRFRSSSGAVGASGNQ
ncbi:PE-PGRS family protein PE_PGRS5-like [Drosophila innubila]|uniref:PE-PGRS family protein PE_PGRS5-like n=1 Tax=Drosophila innubila TaxID=198719 RepID=UPI00148BD660|nr:PE-PGRS family protein PE_PGRS5-like [Drosophila innubila]